MDFVILPLVRRTLLPGACVLLMAGCGGDEAETASSGSIQADSAAPAAALVTPPVTPGDSAAPGTAPAPAASARDSALSDAILKAPVTGPVNVDALANYQLTMEGLRKLVRAGQNLGELQSRRPELRDSMRLEAFDPNAIYDKLNSIPDVREAIGRAGMSPREYATATAALMQAGMVRQLRARGVQPPSQVNEANVRFVDENWAEIQQMMQAAAAQARPRS